MQRALGEQRSDDTRPGIWNHHSAATDCGLGVFCEICLDKMNSLLSGFWRRVELNYSQWAQAHYPSFLIECSCHYRDNLQCDILIFPNSERGAPGGKKSSKLTMTINKLGKVRKRIIGNHFYANTSIIKCHRVCLFLDVEMWRNSQIVFLIGFLYLWYEVVWKWGPLSRSTILHRAAFCSATDECQCGENMVDVYTLLLSALSVCGQCTI